VGPGLDFVGLLFTSCRGGQLRAKIVKLRSKEEGDGGEKVDRQPFGLLDKEMLHVIQGAYGTVKAGDHRSKVAGLGVCSEACFVECCLCEVAARQSSRLVLRLAFMQGFLAASSPLPPHPHISHLQRHADTDSDSSIYINQTGLLLRGHIFC
jgi:hypothetical protein